MAHRYYPDREEFARRAELGNCTPVYAEILADMETPVTAYLKIAGDECSFLLESVEGGERMARYSFLGEGAQTVIQSKGRNVTVTQNGVRENLVLDDTDDVLSVLEQEMSRVSYVPDPKLPKFCGGAVGYLSYDVVRFFEDLPDRTVDDLNIPDCVFILADTLLIFDHVGHRIRVVSNARIDGDSTSAYDAAVERIESLLSKLRQHVNKPDPPITASSSEISSNMTREDFTAAVRKCKDYIAAGDIIQVVLSQRFCTDVAAHPFDVYRALRSLNPSPYMYFLNLEGVRLIGSSPEILVTVEQGTVTSRPIAGTRSRGQSAEHDTRLEQELIADEKERAEHIMLVDLGRNDVGRVCEYGSVHVPEVMVVERYSHVMHLVSHVTGMLRPGLDQFDVLRACFPAGTVSGAPKVRAMEIIDELEPTKRGPYAGAIGYFSYSGDMDTCITIRTILMSGDIAYVQAGAGIVADSNPDSEFDETKNKAAALFRAIEMANDGLN